MCSVEKFDLLYIEILPFALVKMAKLIKIWRPSAYDVSDNSLCNRNTFLAFTSIHVSLLYDRMSTRR